jgi:hypothetical protein
MLLGERVSRTDARIDIYALGITLLEMLTGAHPFASLFPHDQIQAQMAHDFMPSELPRWVQEVLLKATHPTPERRFQTAGDFAEAIRAKHVPYRFDHRRIQADKFAKKAEQAVTRRRWQQAQRLTTAALDLSPDCVPALLAAGRCRILMGQPERGREFFTRALAVSPRTSVQKELGWMHLDEGRLPLAISLLTDHLQRHASDYEAYNLLLKCFYLTERYEAGAELAQAVLDEEATDECFLNNYLVCTWAGGNTPASKLAEHAANGGNPFVHYNRAVATEAAAAWGKQGPSLRSKLLFQEYQFSAAGKRVVKPNTLVLELPDGTHHATKSPVVTIGSLAANEVMLSHGSVSRRHCAIVNYPGDVWLYDLDSTRGTRIDGQPLAGRMLLDEVHDVELGDLRLRITPDRRRLFGS